MGQAIQISEGGLSFVTQSLLQIDDQCVVTFVIPGIGCLVLRAEIVAEKEKIGRMNSYGVEFRTLDLPQRRMIRSYVSAKTQAEAERDEH